MSHSAVLRRPARPNRDNWLAHQARAEIDLLRGDIEAAAERWRAIQTTSAHVGNVDYAREWAQWAAELALWVGRPRDALEEVQRVLPLVKTPELTIVCGRLLVAGMRACGDLAEQARARRDEPAAEMAQAAADGLTSWVDQTANTAFTDHPFVAAIPAERATWQAEQTRLAGPGDPGAWGHAARAWQNLGCPHRAGYAWWRQAQVRALAERTSARRPPACTCRPSCASWASPAGSRPPPWPSGAGSCHRQLISYLP